MKTMTKRGLFGLLSGAALSLASLSGVVFAEDAYPDRPITMMVGYGAGGQTDLVARAAAQVMSARSHRVNPAITGPLISVAIRRTASASSADAMGKPASSTSTPSDCS